MKILEKIKSEILKKRIAKHKAEVQQRYKGGDITIICNNCIGGVIYNILGRQFCSPTVNMFFKMRDYLSFVSDLRYYIDCELRENKKESEEWNFPVGTLKAKDTEHDDINLYFNHYPSFSSAKEKWEDRKGRMIWDKLFIIYDYNDKEFGPELLNEFEKLPYEHKIALIHKDTPGLKYTYRMKCIGKDDPIVKEFEYNGKTGKRNFEEWDYVEFLTK